MAEKLTADDRSTRREVLRKVAVSGGIVALTPIITSVRTPAGALHSPAHVPPSTAPAITGFKQIDNSPFGWIIQEVCGTGQDGFEVQVTNYACGSEYLIGTAMVAGGVWKLDGLWQPGNQYYCATYLGWPSYSYLCGCLSSDKLVRNDCA